MMTKATKIKMNMNMIIDNYEDDNYIVDQEGHIIYLFYEDEDDENNFEKEFNHVIDVNALVDLRTGLFLNYSGSLFRAHFSVPVQIWTQKGT